VIAQSVKEPFESAETPGDESVTIELSDDEALSRGIFSIMVRSTSV